MPKGGTALLTKVIDQYIEMVPTMGKRPKTLENRIFRAQKLRTFVEITDANMTVGGFDDALFVKYLAWLRDTLKHRPQTIENLLIGARTLLRWVVAKKWLEDAPKSRTSGCRPRTTRLCSPRMWRRPSPKRRHR